MLADRAVLAEPAPDVGRRDGEVDRRVLLRREPGLGVLGARRHRGAGGRDRKGERQAAYITNATLSRHSSCLLVAARRATLPRRASPGPRADRLSEADGGALYRLRRIKEGRPEGRPPSHSSSKARQSA